MFQLLVFFLDLSSPLTNLNKNHFTLTLTLMENPKKAKDTSRNTSRRTSQSTSRRTPRRQDQTAAKGGKPPKEPRTQDFKKPTRAARSFFPSFGKADQGNLGASPLLTSAPAQPASSCLSSFSQSTFPLTSTSSLLKR